MARLTKKHVEQAEIMREDIGDMIGQMYEMAALVDIISDDVHSDHFSKCRAHMALSGIARNLRKIAANKMDVLEMLGE